jgi:hypothetical protein
MSNFARSLTLVLLLGTVACGGGGATPMPSPPSPGSGSVPVFAGEANSATDGAGAAFNRASLSLNVSGANTLLAAWHAEFDGGLPDGWTVTANGVPGTPIVDTN